MQRLKGMLNPLHAPALALIMSREPPLPDRESVLFIGAQFSNLYTAVDTPAARAA
jgi:hypothetical protein